MCAPGLPSPGRLKQPVLFIVEIDNLPGLHRRSGLRTSALRRLRDPRGGQPSSGAGIEGGKTGTLQARFAAPGPEQALEAAHLAGEVPLPATEIDVLATVEGPIQLPQQADDLVGVRAGPQP